MKEQKIISPTKQHESLIQIDHALSVLMQRYPLLSNREELVFSLREAVASEAPALSVIANKTDVKIVLKWIRAQLLEVFLFTGAMSNISEYQVIALAKHIYGTYYYLTFEELSYFFYAFENGSYGKFFVGSVINVQNIMEALSKFEADVLEQRGFVEDQREEEKKAKADKGKLTGMAAWFDYCKKSGRKDTTMPDISKIVKDKTI